MGCGGENTGGDFLHEATHEFENHQASGDDNKHYDNIARGEEDKLEEIANKWDGESGDHNADDSDEEAGTELVEWF